MLNVLRVLLHTCYVALGCCFFSIESGNVRVESSNDGSYRTNETDKKAREGDGVIIQLEKHQEVISHIRSPFSLRCNRGTRKTQFVSVSHLSRLYRGCR